MFLDEKFNACVCLQEELLGLKSELTGNVKVSKGGGKVVLTYYVEAPVEASNYDVDALTIRTTLEKGAADDSLGMAARVKHVHIELPVSAELPGKLRAAIASELGRRWRSKVILDGEAHRPTAEFYQTGLSFATGQALRTLCRQQQKPSLKRRHALTLLYY